MATADTDDLKNAIRKWVQVLADPEVAKEFEGYNKTMQFIFSDLDVKMQLVFEGARTKIVEGFRQDADMSLTVSSEVFMGIASGDVDPMDAFMEGKLKPTGDVADLEKLQVLLT
jgi:putative sterol carrier protein